MLLRAMIACPTCPHLPGLLQHVTAISSDIIRKCACARGATIGASLQAWLHASVQRTHILRRAQRAALAPLDSSSQPSSILKLRGLPFSATTPDVAAWFNEKMGGMLHLTAESCAPVGWS